MIERQKTSQHLFFNLTQAWESFNFSTIIIYDKAEDDSKWLMLQFLRETFQIHKINTAVKRHMGRIIKIQTLVKSRKENMKEREDQILKNWSAELIKMKKWCLNN